jgi:Mg/Co/Ni transporter MgtE
MGTQVTLTLPDDTLERAAKYAAYAHRDVSEIIAAALASSLPSMDAIDQLRAISKLPDKEIVALTELRMENETDRRLSELLDHQQAGELTDLERAELAALMRAYEMGLLRQSQALVEAVHRGLRPPLEP